MIRALAKRMLWGSTKISSDGSEILWRPRRLINARGRFSAGRNLFVGRDSVFNFICDYEGQKFEPVLEIGDNVYVGHHFSLHCANRIVLGDDVVISDNVYISDNSHGLDPSLGNIMKQKLKSETVQIGDSCFIGYGSSVLPGVSLGPWTIVGTRSVVTKSTAGFVMLAGAPARVIKVWDFESQKWVAVDKVVTKGVENE